MSFPIGKDLTQIIEFPYNHAVSRSTYSPPALVESNYEGAQEFPGLNNLSSCCAWL